MPGAIHTHVGARLAVVEISQPNKRNALSQQMALDLRETLQALSARDDVGCVLLRGDGPLAFCAGADISEFGERRGDPDVARQFDAVFQGAADAIGGCRHPVVAAIRGACVGGGLQLAMQADIRLAGRNARFGVPVSKLGLAAAWGELAPMVQLAGAAVTLEILLEGGLIGAERAASVGLVNRVVDDEALAAEAQATAERILAGAPLVARWHKQFVRRLQNPRELSADELAQAYACFGTADYQEGWQAFLAKRTPAFRGQ
jgi:enoyl-CoA hydratase/carnithine racemase